MWYTKALQQFDRYKTAEWGQFTRYLEIADDLFALRRADLYANGYGLCYDRYRWVDQFGMLGSARHTPEFKRKESRRWIVVEITPAEFNAAWAAVQEAPNQPQQYDASAFNSVGERLSHLTAESRRRMPPWIARLFPDEQSNPIS